MGPVSALYIAVALAAGGGSADPLPWDGQTFRRYEAPGARLAFPVPLTQTMVESRHFAAASEGQMSDLLTVSGPDGYELELGVWQNPRGLELPDWLAAYAPFLRTSDTVLVLWQTTPEHVRAQLFEQPRDGQTWARRTAVFRLGSRVVKLTCLNRDDARSEAEFAAILEQLEALP